jgi:hypothetical protein
MSTGTFHEGINFAAVQRLASRGRERKQRVRLQHTDAVADRGRERSGRSGVATASPA